MRPACVALLVVLFLAACGKTGDLYLPDRPGAVVTRPATTPPEAGESSNSPQTVDSPPVPANPAPEVTEPESKKKKPDGTNDPPPR